MPVLAIDSPGPGYRAQAEQFAPKKNKKITPPENTSGRRPARLFFQSAAAKVDGNGAVLKGRQQPRPIAPFSDEPIRLFNGGAEVFLSRSGPMLK